MGYQRDTGCSEQCRVLQALAAGGFGSAYEVYQQQQLVGALQYVAYQQQMLAWTQAATVAQQAAATRRRRRETAAEAADSGVLLVR